MDREFALQAKDISIDVTRRLLEIVKLTSDWDTEEMRRLHKAIGITVGKIEVDIIAEIYRSYPDMEDLS
ncbi:hypothetical protein ACFSQQ_34935 [Mesorhizobium kowhaii]|uniref:Uncharacterized protein n=1 Tax=Mesorhizobium kowhaii TaxID=1300272 RepID=A0A2W7C5I4_9HYPH|nr:hypothetical protein [Mesorhizobium kowhaii]PZV37621.1 hypothetical protein B5V02_15165 [Mesorhizobium kowhaii]